jgi:nicotinamidase-related amidase
MKELTNRSNQIHGLLTPDNCTLVLIDHQPQMAFGVQSIDRQLLLNNVVGLAKAAKVFDVPTVLTTVAAKTFSGELFPEVQAVFPDTQPIDRHNINAWDDPAFRDAVQQAGRSKLVVAALWTEVCLAMPVIDMLLEGYEVYVVSDASGGTTLNVAVEHAGAYGIGIRYAKDMLDEPESEAGGQLACDELEQTIEAGTC